MKIIERDLMEIEEGIIIHQANCQGVMNSGVAKAIITKYPKVKEDYLNLFKELGDDKLYGKVQLVQVTDKLIVCNSFSQKYYGRTGKFTDEKLLVKAITYICKKFSEENVYAPYMIGCGLGGGDWKKVEEQTKDLENLIYCKV